MWVGWRESTTWGNKWENGYFPVEQEAATAGWKSQQAKATAGGLCERIWPGSERVRERRAIKQQHSLCGGMAAVSRESFSVRAGRKHKSSDEESDTVLRRHRRCVWTITGRLIKLQRIVLSDCSYRSVNQVFVAWPPSAPSLTPISSNNTEITKTKTTVQNFTDCFSPPETFDLWGFINHEHGEEELMDWWLLCDIQTYELCHTIPLINSNVTVI